MSPKWHPNSATNTMRITPWATHGQVPSARSQKDVTLAANGGHMDPKRDPKSVFFGIRFCQFLGIFPHSILEVIYDSLFKDCHDLRVAFGDHFAYICFNVSQFFRTLFFDDIIVF